NHLAAQPTGLEKKKERKKERKKEKEEDDGREREPVYVYGVAITYQVKGPAVLTSRFMLAVRLRPSKREVDCQLDSIANMQAERRKGTTNCDRRDITTSSPSSLGVWTEGLTPLAACDAGVNHPMRRRGFSLFALALSRFTSHFCPAAAALFQLYRRMSSDMLAIKLGDQTSPNPTRAPSPFIGNTSNACVSSDGADLAA
ncbi:hypothetical protein TRV_04454, partial [Trichophyton verrucosum HKI 0517]